MKLYYSRDTMQGLALYYINALAFILSAIYAWNVPAYSSITFALVTFLLLLLQDVLWFKKHYYVPQDKLLIDKITELIEEKHTRELLTEFDLKKYLINDKNLKNLQTING